MKKLLMFPLIMILAMGSVALTDTLPPWDRESDGTTWQRWDFFTDATGPMAPDDFFNPYGDSQAPLLNQPLLMVDTSNDHIDRTTDGYRGVGIWPLGGAWPLNGEMDIYIPNRPTPFPLKEIYIQLTWKAPDTPSNSFMPTKPVIGFSTSDSMYMSLDQHDDLGSGWWMSRFAIQQLSPNPPEEWITIGGDILVDQIIIDTRCIPEPATVLLLGMGGLIALKRKRKGKCA